MRSRTHFPGKRHIFVDDAMDNQLWSLGIFSCAVFPCRRNTFSAKAKNVQCQLTTVTTVLLLLLAVITPSINAQRPRSSSNHVSKNLAACNSNSDCDSSITFLRCHQRTCKCAAIHLFDEDFNRCLIRVGGSCARGSPKSKQDCVAYAECDFRGKANAASGECKCRSRFKETIENTCVSGAQSSYYFHSAFSSIILSLALLVMQKFTL